jgi:hypothetical protein
MGLDDAGRLFNAIGSFGVKYCPNLRAGARTDWLRLSERERERRLEVVVVWSSSNVGFGHWA